eukprot:190857-Pyramimonas_sp.AAC.1
MSGIANSPGEWTIPCGEKIQFEGSAGPGTLRFEVGPSLEQQHCAQASEHLEGSGAEFGVD